MRFTFRAGGLSALSLLAIAAPASARVTDAVVAPAANGQLAVSWSLPGAVDVYASTQPNADLAAARLVSADDRDGRAMLPADPVKRTYVYLKDRTDGTVTEVAQRLVPLQQGSNFRDIGGYAAAGGKHVRWGLIYRSGASAMLTPADLDRVKALGLRNLVDLRSDEERVLAPTKIDGVHYSAVGYSMAALMSHLGTGATQAAGAKVSVPQNGVAIYHSLPEMLVPQMRILFRILAKGATPVEYNCSAGQDRTGFATAMILSALGVPRDVIYRDYLLSTQYRQPRYEMPHIDPARYPDNRVAQFFAHFQDNPAYATPQPLKEADGTPFLKGAFDAIDAKWGSVDNYLMKAVGLSDQDLARIRAAYLQ